MSEDKRNLRRKDGYLFVLLENDAEKICEVNVTSLSGKKILMRKKFGDEEMREVGILDVRVKSLMKINFGLATHWHEAEEIFTKYRLLEILN